MTDAEPPSDSTSSGDAATAAHDAPVPRRRSRPWLVAGSVVIVSVVAFIAVTGVTGLGAPGWMQRYRYSELSDLASRINTEAGDLRTPDDCWRTLPSKEDAERDPDGPLRDIARVDYLRSRVVVRVYANESGRVDTITQRIVADRLESVFADSPHTWKMVKLEPSPDGWSPLVSCRLVTRGWITGF